MSAFLGLTVDGWQLAPVKTTTLPFNVLASSSEKCISAMVADLGAEGFVNMSVV